METGKINGGAYHSWRLKFTDVGPDASETDLTAYVKVEMLDAEPEDNIDTILNKRPPKETKGGGKLTAAQWLNAWLRIKGGEARENEIIEAGAASQPPHTAAALKKARQRLGIVSEKRGFNPGEWWWVFQPTEEGQAR